MSGGDENKIIMTIRKGVILIGNSEALTKFHVEMEIKEKGESPQGKGYGLRKNLKRKRQNGSTNAKEKSKKKEKEVEFCKTCGKNHNGVCLKGKNVCFRCKAKGHCAPKCPKFKPNACFTCKEVGHMAKDCPKRKLGKVEESKKKEKINACEMCGKEHVEICLKGTNTCYHCRKDGHIASNCPELKKCICRICQERGHLSKCCPRKIEKAEKVKISNDNNPTKNRGEPRVDYAMVYMANV